MVPSSYANVQAEIPDCYTRSSLLIPSSMLSYFQSRCAASGGRAAYLNFLVINHLLYLHKFKNRLCRCHNPKWKIAYQNSGQKLLKRNLKPVPADWENLRNVAHAFGVSMCFLFVFLMELEMEGFFEKTPKISTERSFAWNSTRWKAMDAIRSSKLCREMDGVQQKLKIECWIE